MRNVSRRAKVVRHVAVLALCAAAAVSATAWPAASRADEAISPADTTGVPSDSAAFAAPLPVPVPSASAFANDRPVVGTKLVKLVGKTQNVVRTGPGNEFAIAGVYPKDRTFTVIAKNGDWYGVKLSDTETGWVHASLCKELDDLSGLEFKPNPKLYTRTGSYVLGGYGGAYAFDRKSNSLVLGGRLGYYLFDRIEAEAGVAWTHVQRPQEIVESLFGLSLEAEDFQMLFYHLNVCWEILPGRQMVPYVGVGAGSTIMLGKSEPSYDFGAGVKLFTSKRSAVRWEVRDYRFKSGSEEARVTNDNIEFTLGTEILF